MRANRRALEHPRRFGKDEQGVSEAVGYIITFGISTIVLVTSLQAFLVIQRHTNDIAIDRAVHEVSAQVAFAVDEALRAGSTYPDANFAMSLTIPREVAGGTYTISLHEDHVWVEATDALPEEHTPDGEKLETRGRARADYVQRAGAESLCKLPTTEIPDGVCRIQSHEGELVITFADPDGVAGPLTPGVYIKRVA